MPLTAAYRPLPGAADELVGADGRPQPHWAPVLASLREPVAKVEARFAVADRHLRHSGVYYRVYDSEDGGERAWPLSHVPLVLTGPEWRAIEAGIVERATLLQAVLADIHGPRRLIADGALPAAVVAGNPGFLRPLAETQPRGGDHLIIYAADLGRGPDGRWWVLNDRAQAPSGMGYALENRLAIAAAFPALYRDMQVERLAAFFQRLREGLAARALREGARIGLLTPGPANETYFEHAYLARYLGFLLVEGGDLAVQDGYLHVRTIEGLKRLDVLMRRLDAGFCDPMELDTHSRIGVPGLVDAVRRGNVVLANSLGAGLVEAKAMMAFLPALARRFLGRDLTLSNIATWWCGDPEVRDEVAGRLDQVSLDAAFARHVPGLARGGPTLADQAGPGNRQRLSRALAEHGRDIVAQEMVKLSTMPVWREGLLEPRPFTLRVFAVKTGGGWSVMPGGFCRVSESADPRLLSMQRGGRSADVWVTSEGPVDQVTLLPRPDRPVAIRRKLGHLPSRAADNLFWLGRYLERGEATLRLVRALAEFAAEGNAEDEQAATRLANLLIAWGASPESDDAEAVVKATMSSDRPGSARHLTAQAVRTASVIRERLSPDAMRSLEELRQLVETHDGPAGDVADRALRVVAAFSGLAQENMNRISGWRLLEIGRRAERAILTCRMVRVLAEAPANPEALDALLKVTDSRITYRSRYLMGTLSAPVLDLAMLDVGNPRSVAFQVERLLEHVAALPTGGGERVSDPVRRALKVLNARLETEDAHALDSRGILEIEGQLFSLAGDFGQRLAAGADAKGDAVEDLG